MKKIRLPLLVLSVLLAASARAEDAKPPRNADSDKLEAAADNIARMKTALKMVLGRAEDARNEKDVVKLNCVNEKLTQIKSLIKVAEQADLALHESIAAKSATGDAEFSKIAIARTKVDGLRRDSEQCIGQLAYIVDDKTTVQVEQPSNLPGGAAPEPGLGIASRGTNPADSVGDIGVGAMGGYGGLPFTPPAVVRAPMASPYR